MSDTIIYVDSNKLNSEIFIKAFKDYGLEVKAFESTNDVVEFAIENNTLVMFIDIDFSNQEGLSFARLIKDNDLLKETSVFMIGTADANEFGWLAVDAGCEQYFSRPINFEELLPQVELFLKSNEEIQRILISEDDSGMEDLLEIFLDANYEDKIVIEKTNGPDTTLDLSTLEKTLGNTSSEDDFLKVIEDSFLGVRPKRVEGIYKKVKAARLNNSFLKGINVYVKLSKGHFVKVISKDDAYDPNNLSSYLAKGVTSFYLDHESYAVFSLNVLENIGQKLKDENLEQNESLVLQFESIAEIRKVVQGLGIKPAVIAVADEVVKSVLTIAKREKKLFDLLKNFYDKTDYVTTHSQFMNYIFAAIVSEIPGSHSSQDTLNKFIRASMLCDIVLKNTEFAAAHNIESKEFENLHYKVKRDLENHMKTATKLLEDSRLISDDELTFIANHHERPQGGGFPRGVNGSSLSLLTCYFITVYDFTDRLLRSPKKENINPVRIIESMEELYNEGSYKNALESLLKKFQ